MRKPRLTQHPRSVVAKRPQLSDDALVAIVGGYGENPDTPQGKTASGET